MNLSECFCRFTDQGVSLKGEKLMDFDRGSTTDNLTALYRHSGIEYPKFYKMDLLSKVSLLGVEMLKRCSPDLALLADDAIGLLFANSEASSDTDVKFRESYEVHQLPSPSLFVYTLPNIAMGEIAIRNKWYGSNMFAVFPNFAPAYFIDYGTLMLHEGAERVICGWVDVRDRLDALFFIMMRNGNSEKTIAIRRLEAFYSESKK